MILKNTKFGEIDVNEDLIFTFIEPILGYEHLKKFALVDHLPNSPFKWLQSIEDINVSLPVTIPAYFDIKYEFVVPEEEAKKLEATTAESLLILNVVNIPSGAPEKATVNLIGPIVINADNKKATQLVLVNTNYSIKHKLFEDAPKTGKDAE